MTNSGLIFVSYARPDQDRVKPYCEYLRQNGFDIWVDYDALLPGQRWDFEIQRALARADFVIVFVSKKSIDRRGYLQRELSIAIDNSAARLIDDIYLIPILLDDDAMIPQQLASWQHIAASRPDCQNQIRDAINRQRERLGLKRQGARQRDGLSWETQEVRESWEGLPGYEIALQFIVFSSEKGLALDEIGAYIRGELLKTLLSFRRQRFDQLPDIFNYGQDKIMRTNTHDAVCGSPSLVGNVLSVPYQINWYGAGAAHPNSGFRIFNFILNPVSLMPPLREIFTNQDLALLTLQNYIRQQLYELVEEDGKPRLEKSWIDEGTANWDQLAPYEFDKTGIRFIFAPYHVGPYSLGYHTVEVPFREVVKLLRPDFVNLFSVNYVLREVEGR